MAPAPMFCGEKKRLQERYTAAVSKYLRAQSAQLLAIQRGDGLLFENEIEAARIQKDFAKRAILEHEREHGC